MIINNKIKRSLLLTICLFQFAPLADAQNGLIDELKSKINAEKNMRANAKRWPVEWEFSGIVLCADGDQTQMSHSQYMAKLDACFCGLKQAEEQKTYQQLEADANLNEVSFTSLIVRNARSRRCQQ